MHQSKFSLLCEVGRYIIGVCSVTRWMITMNKWRYVMKMNRRHPRFVLRRRSFGGLRGGSDSWACEWGVFSWSFCDLGCLAIWMQFCERQQCREEVCRRHVPAPSKQRVPLLSFLPSVHTSATAATAAPGIKASLWGRERERGNRTDAARPHDRNIHGSHVAQRLL